MSTFYKNQIHEKPIVTIIYQPWDAVSRKNLTKWRTHRSWAITPKLMSCLDSAELIKRFNIRKYPFAILTDIYGTESPMIFEDPFDLSSLEAHIIE